MEAVFDPSFFEFITGNDGSNALQVSPTSVITSRSQSLSERCAGAPVCTRLDVYQHRIA
jgi:hypothetical protein